MKLFPVILVIGITACSSVSHQPLDSYAPKPNEWVNVGEEGVFRVRCCDCGLTHVFQVMRDENGVYWWRGIVDDKATTEWRRIKLHIGGLDICRLCPGNGLNMEPRR